MTPALHKTHGRGRKPLPAAIRAERQEAYRDLISKLYTLGSVTADIAAALSVTPSYINLMRQRQTPPLHILAALRKLVIAEMEKAEAKKRRQADRIAALMRESAALFMGEKRIP